MFSQLVLVAIALPCRIVAQTFNDCDPTKKDCPANPAFGNTFECDFTEGECSVFEASDGTRVNYTSRNGAEFVISKDTHAPTLATSKYLFFGRVEIEVHAAEGTGIVTSLALTSDILDEIDWEWVGADDNQVQTNYFSRGDDTTSDRGAYHPISDPLSAFHTYTVEWTANALIWSVDGDEVRTLRAKDTENGTAFPQTPMQIKFGTWVAGRESAPEATIEWAGGKTDFSDGPFQAYLKSVKIEDYAGGDKPASGGIKEYKYTNRDGTADSLKVVKGPSADDDETKSGTSATTSSESRETSLGSTTATDLEAVSTSGGADSASTNGSSSDNGSSDGGLSPGAAAGIAVGAVLAAVLIVVAGYVFWRRKRKATKKMAAAVATTSAEHDQSSGPEISELSSKSPAMMQRGELAGSQIPAELDGGQTWRQTGSAGNRGPVELDARGAPTTR